MARDGDTLTTRQLNRALLARQHLLARSTASLPRALESVGGLQMQYAPSGYVGCWSRGEGVTIARVTRALERRQIVQGTLLRSTIHLVSARDFQVLAAGTRRARQEWWRPAARARGLAEIDHEAVAAMVRSWFADGPLERAELLERLEAEGVPRAHWEGLAQWVDLVRVPPQGTWARRRAHLFASAEVELGPSTATEAEGLALLVERYLGGFGPASVADLSSWAGVPAGWFEPVLAALGLRRFRDVDGGELIDLPRRPIPPAETPAPVRFLGTWDATLLVHARRTQILPEAVRDRVFGVRRPHSVNTLLVDGQVVGSWRIERDRVTVEPFEAIPAAFADAVEAERRAHEAFAT
ncbi:winged helix DNA-binding domain-containing protein [Euzebya sp.]|uniref:winged helix DNA-binding domain-containing protein n=1 Tax=Euzebya sp. TaxID=1971409 RepID=UPI0035180646